MVEALHPAQVAAGEIRSGVVALHAEPVVAKLVREDLAAPDADDFVHAPGAGGPDWHLGSVVYEIFPDRFATTGLGVEPPGWAVPREWGALPEGRSKDTAREYFGGDLRGHRGSTSTTSSALGANVIYLTPFFPAGSRTGTTRRRFERVDPLLGGDEALASLTAAAHARGMRVIGDITPNHTGDTPRVVRRARRPTRTHPSASSTTSTSRFRTAMSAWWGITVLPKLEPLARSSRAGCRRSSQKWIARAVRLDGWRMDVANMAGRYRGVDSRTRSPRRIRGRAGGQARGAASSPSTRTTSAPTSRAAAGRGR